MWLKSRFLYCLKKKRYDLLLSVECDWLFVDNLMLGFSSKATTEQQKDWITWYKDPHWDQAKLKSHVTTTLFFSTFCLSPLYLSWVPSSCADFSPVLPNPLLSVSPLLSQTLLPSLPSERLIQYVSWIPWTPISPLGWGLLNQTHRIRADREETSQIIVFMSINMQQRTVVVHV